MILNALQIATHIGRLKTTCFKSNTGKYKLMVISKPFPWPQHMQFQSHDHVITKAEGSRKKQNAECSGKQQMLILLFHLYCLMGYSRVLFTSFSEDGIITLFLWAFLWHLTLLSNKVTWILRNFQHPCEKRKGFQFRFTKGSVRHITHKKCPFILCVQLAQDL